MEEVPFDWDYKLNPVIVVGILNFSIKHEKEWPEGRFHSSYRIREDLTHEPMTENLRFVYLELGRFKKKLVKEVMLSDSQKDSLMNFKLNDKSGAF